MNDITCLIYQNDNLQSLQHLSRLKYKIHKLHSSRKEHDFLRRSLTNRSLAVEFIRLVLSGCLRRDRTPRNIGSIADYHRIRNLHYLPLLEYDDGILLIKTYSRMRFVLQMFQAIITLFGSYSIIPNWAKELFLYQRPPSSTFQQP